MGGKKGRKVKEEGKGRENVNMTENVSKHPENSLSGLVWPAAIENGNVGL